MKIGVMGTPVSSGNRGVMALGTSLVNLCSGNDRKVVLLLGHSDTKPVPFPIGEVVREVPIVNYRLSPRARLREHLAWIVAASLMYRALPLGPLRRALSRFTPWIAFLEEADLVGDVRGGDSFSDIYGMERFITGFLMAWTVLLVKGNIVQFPQTYGPYKRLVSRLLAGYLLRRSSVVIARDAMSRRVAQDLVGPNREVWLSPDVAFSLDSVQPKRLELEPPLSGSIPLGVLGLNVNGLMYNGGYTRKNMFDLQLDYRNFLPRLVEAILMEFPGELWLVPHVYAPPGNVESDPDACWRVREAIPEALKPRVRIVKGEYDCRELKGIIGRMDFFIGSRMHSCIAALSQGIPCVGIAYSRKFQGVFETVGMGDWVVDGREVADDEAIAHVMDLYHKRDEVSSELKRRAEQARKELQETFERLFGETTRQKSRKAGGREAIKPGRA